MPEKQISKMNHPVLSPQKERLYRMIGIMLTSAILYAFYAIPKKFWPAFE